MNRQEIIERVASGLRRMKTTPDALLFSDYYDVFWDEPEILGIRVYNVDCCIYWDFNNSITEPSCPFMPVFSDVNCKPFNSNYFFKGWEEYV